MQENAVSDAESSTVKARYIRVSGRGYQGTWGGPTNAFSNKVMFSEIQVFGAYVPTKEELAAKLDEAKAYTADGYTTDSFKQLTDAITAAEIIIGKEDASQVEINTAAAKLVIAMDELKAKPDTSALAGQIQILEDKMKEDAWGLLSAERQKVYNDILTEAKELLGDENAVQKTVDEMNGKLEKAAADLSAEYEEAAAKETQKQILSDAITEAQTVNLDGYTKESIQSFNEVLEFAQKVFNDPDAMKADYRDAFEKLEAAVSALTTVDPDQKPNPDDKPNPDNSGKQPNGDGKPSQVQNEKPAKTGDMSHPLAAAVVMVISLAVCIVVIFRKKNRKNM